MTEPAPHAPAVESDDAEQFRHLPERVRPEDTITSQATEFAKDPEMGLMVDRYWAG